MDGLLPAPCGGGRYATSQPNPTNPSSLSHDCRDGVVLAFGPMQARRAATLLLPTALALSGAAAAEFGDPIRGLSPDELQRFGDGRAARSEEHTSELQSPMYL